MNYGYVDLWQVKFKSCDEKDLSPSHRDIISRRKMRFERDCRERQCQGIDCYTPRNLSMLRTQFFIHSTSSS